MGPPVEVEFFTGTGTGTGSSIDSGDDSVEFGPGAMPRWVIAFGLLAVAVVLAGLASRLGHRPTPAPTPQPAIRADSPSPTSGLGTPIPIQGVTPAIELAVSVPLYLLQSGHLYKFTDTSAVGVALDGPGFARVGSSAQLVVDAEAERVWVVIMNTPGGEIVEFDARNLHRLRTMRSAASVGDAAALRAHLYLAATVGVTDIAPGAAEPKLIKGLHGFVASVAADPRRSRILALVLGARTAIRELPMGGAVRSTEVDVALARGNLRVTQDGAIWVAGFSRATRGAVMVRIDPRTLHPLTSSLVVNQLGPGGWIESAGDRDVWVRRAGDDDGLWCVDGRSGTVLQYWPRVPGAVTSHRGGAYVLSGGALVPLILAGCGG